MLVLVLVAVIIVVAIVGLLLQGSLLVPTPTGKFLHAFRAVQGAVVAGLLARLGNTFSSAGPA